jgi:hypothetical protein
VSPSTPCNLEKLSHMCSDRMFDCNVSEQLPWPKALPHHHRCCFHHRRPHRSHQRYGRKTTFQSIRCRQGHRIYLSETATGAARGFAVSIYQNIQILGVILASGIVFASSKSVTQSAYLIPMGLQLIAPAIMVLLCPFLPESPRWLVWKK